MDNNEEDGDENPGRDGGPDEPAADPDSSGHPTDVTLSLDATLELLFDNERRALLRYLLDAPENTATIQEIVEPLAEHDSEKRGKRPARNKIEASLYHVHIPKLADVGIIDYDASSEQVRYWRNDRLERWLTRIHAEEPD